MTSATTSPPVGRAESPTPRRGMRRHALLQATRELLAERQLRNLSVSAISARAGVSRSGFYSYFDSLSCVLATASQGCIDDMEELSQHLSARQAGESPEQFVIRLLRAVTVVFASNDPVVQACVEFADASDQVRKVWAGLIDSVTAEVQQLIVDEFGSGKSRPVTEDIPTLMCILMATTQRVLSGHITFVGRCRDVERARRILECLWLDALWGRSATKNQIDADGVVGPLKGHDR